MVKKSRFLIITTFLICLLIFILPITNVSAQNYEFKVTRYEVEAYIESDGTLTLKYLMDFKNSPSGKPIDFVDLGLPYAEYQVKNISAQINEIPITHIQNSEYVHGVELGLKNNAIPSGATGVVTANVYGMTKFLTPYDGEDKENFANFQFTPSYFDSSFDRSNNTHYRMTIILPPGVGTDQGVYYKPGKFPQTQEVEASTTTDGRVYYSWYSDEADTHTSYLFGAAFPASTVPSNAIGATFNSGSNQGSSSSFWSEILSCTPCLFGLIPLAIFIAAVIKNAKNAKDHEKRKMEYLPPKISIEGHGIKRGLTAVEAGILMEQPIDRILTMILFGVIKKDAVMVAQKEPLEILVKDPMPADLHEYEKSFILAFKSKDKEARRRALRSTIIDLVKVVTDKMKGFSVPETVAYYKDIVARAWSSVEGSATPEVKMATYEKALEWTMLDKEYGPRTERTFSGGPVILPRWWGRYDPVYRSGGGVLSSPKPSSSPSTTTSRPLSIPGADFAASMVNNASAMTASLIGNVGVFTGSVTSRTNPIPAQPRSGGGFRGGGGGGSSCACACACAGCACACAGGGR